MDKLTGRSLYEKTCPPGEINVITGRPNKAWDELSKGSKFSWEITAESMERIKAEDDSVRQA